MESKKLIKTRSFVREPVLRLSIIGFLFVAAFCLRLYGLFNPLMDFFPVRQYHSALLARGLYEWLLTGELNTIPPDGIIEPPILELVTSFAYLIFGGEHLWIPRLLSVMCWMVGGVFLYHIAKKISSPNAAVFSVFFYLFVPFSVLPSRAFMPDSLMVMLLLISVFTVLRYHEQPSTRRMLIAALASSLAVFVKPIMCFFPIFGAFTSLAVYRRGVRQSLTSPQLLIFTMLSILPAGFYYLYGTFAAGFLQGQLERKVVPQLLLEADFWGNWSIQIGVVVGYVPLIGALLGLLLLRSGFPRALMIGLWGGYLLLGLVYTHHIHTHNYYSLQLIPVVALSLGPVVALVINQLSQLVNPNSPGRVGSRYYARVTVLAILVLALVLGTVQYGQNVLAYRDRFTSTYTNEVENYQEIGEIVGHSRHTLLLFGSAVDFGYPLLYHGRFSATLFPRHYEMRGLSAEEHFNNLYSEHSPEYFVISSRLDYEVPGDSNFWESERYEDLRNFLTANYPLIAQDDDYVVFDLREEN